MKVQPTKIILINSANCQYAEFDLSDSLHLVARNNKGKTSIINTLQFLYIDNHKEIDLGYTLDKSWTHYFPELGSYVLFELNTLSGKKVFGLAASGLGSQPEKFLYNGAYQVEDFLDHKKGHYIPKKPEKLFPEISTKLIARKLQSKNHRDILRPFEQKTNSSGLGLIGDTRDYQLFKRLFRQLLQLKNITIKSLKTQIEDINHRLMEKDKQINVQREFNEPYNKVTKQKNDLKKLQYNQSNITDLLELSEQQITLQGRLISYSLKSHALFVAEEKQLNEQCQIHEDKRLRLKEEKLPEISIQREERQLAGNEQNQALGVIKKELEDYEKLQKECLQIVIEFEEQHMHELQHQEEKFQQQLFNAKDENLTQLEQSLQFKREQRDKNQTLLNSISDTLFAQLKELLSEQELRKLYQISNPALWGLFKDNGFTLKNAKALQTFLKQSLQQVQDTACKLPGLTLDLSSITTNTLYEMADPDFLGKKISEIKQKIIQFENKITAVREQEQIRHKLKQTQIDIEATKYKIERHQQWIKGKEGYQKQKNQRDIYELDIKKILQDINTLIAQEAVIKDQITQHNDTIRHLKKDIGTLTQQKRWIETHPIDTNGTAIEVIYETSNFATLYEQYKKHYEDLLKKSTDIKNKINNLQSVFRQLMDKSDSQALTFLQQELESIPEQEKSIHDEWKRIFTSFAAHCRGMIDSVDAIDSYLADLNRLLSKEKISNLQSVKVQLETNQWHQHIHNIKEWKEHDMPLFSSQNNNDIDKLLKAITPLLEKVKISISDLYDLKLLVTDEYGNKKHYDNLNLESTGTSITVKTIIYISMINEAMKGKQSLGESIRLPFYVDEIDSLDDFNAENIHDIALKLGLIPIFASPKGSGICKRLYQLDNNARGKLTIREKDTHSGKLLLIRPTFEKLE